MAFDQKGFFTRHQSLHFWECMASYGSAAAIEAPFLFTIFLTIHGSQAGAFRLRKLKKSGSCRGFLSHKCLLFEHQWLLVDPFLAFLEAQHVFFGCLDLPPTVAGARGPFSTSTNPPP